MAGYVIVHPPSAGYVIAGMLSLGMGQEQEAAEAARRFAEEQKVQIAANAERRRHEREESLQEGARIMAQLQQHRRKVEVSIRVPRLPPLSAHPSRGLQFPCACVLVGVILALPTSQDKVWQDELILEAQASLA